MQAAHWVGRASGAPSGRVSAHLYSEFDGGGLDPERLRRAVAELGRLHPMLRLRIDAEGRQHLDPRPDPLALTVEDLSDRSEPDLCARLAAKRRTWTHRSLDLAAGEAAAFGLSLLPGEACRLHIDTDMSAVDPGSLRLVMEDLARLYAEPAAPPGPAPGYFAWLDRLAADPARARRRERDRAWWRAALPGIAPAPALPEPAPTAVPESLPLTERLGPPQREALDACARRLRITPSSLLLGLFAAVLGRETGSRRFRLNVPTFWREPAIPDAGRIVGEFSNVLILSVALGEDATLAETCRDVAVGLVGPIAHSAYPGVDVMRDLSRLRGGVEIAPVVFTAGFGLPGRTLFADAVSRVFGPMIFAVSQGPHVALDAQVADFEGGLLVNFDVRLDLLPEKWIRGLFAAYLELLRAVAADPGRLDAPLSPSGPPESDPAHATEAMLLALLRRLAPGEAARADAPIAAAAREGLAAFVAAYLPACDRPFPALDGASTPRLLARRIHRRSGGASEALARIYLETIHER